MKRVIKNIIHKLKYGDEKLLKEINEIKSEIREIEWAHNFQNSIRGIKELENLPIYPGRWAGSYAFFYVLCRILTEYKFSSILELGLGESTKFISEINKYCGNQFRHIIIEQDEKWANNFINRKNPNNNFEIKICPLAINKINGYEVYCYSELSELMNTVFDFYIIDGPWGSDRFSRYDLILLIEKITLHDDFLILFDDTNRQGEKDTLQVLFEKLKSKNIEFYYGNYVGNKTCTVIASEKYKFCTSF